MAAAVLIALQDYTIDQRGDIGSVLRLEGISAVQAMCKCKHFYQLEGRDSLLEALSSLAGEKLDKVRYQAWHCLSSFWQHHGGGEFAELPAYPALVELVGKGDEAVLVDTDQVNSRKYFLGLLSFFRYRPLVSHLIRGLMTSISGGSESVLAASRSALSEYIYALDHMQLSLFCESFENVMRTNLSTERLVVPMLETLAYIIDINRIKEANNATFR